MSMAIHSMVGVEGLHAPYSCQQLLPGHAVVML